VLCEAVANLAGSEVHVVTVCERHTEDCIVEDGGIMSQGRADPGPVITALRGSSKGEVTQEEIRNDTAVPTTVESEEFVQDEIVLEPGGIGAVSPGRKRSQPEADWGSSAWTSFEVLQSWCRMMLLS
jgi:hypothetical protein